MSTSNVYATRKRRKPVQKSVQHPHESVKSNPSKRHRDRLNGELDRLASLLPFPQEIISKLDKITILRLSVSYLRAKSHFNVTLNSKSSRQLANNTKPHIQEQSEGELLLQVLNGFVLVVTSRGTIFYASSTIEDYLGFHQSDLIHQSIYELIHTEDRAEFQKQLHWALSPSGTSDAGQLVQASHDVPLPQMYYSPERLPPENSTFLERNFVCRLRCLLDNSSRFLAMNFQGRLKFLYGQNERTEDGKPVPPQLALFALACPLQPPAILEIRTKSFMFRTKHKLDFTPTGCDAKGKIILGYTEAELCYRGSGYQFIHAADMLYCAENHMRMMKMGESGLTVFRLLTKHNLWVWVQASARLIYKNGQPDFIIASQRAITDEEGEENLRKRTMTLPFNFTTGEAVLYDMNLSRSLSNSPNSNPSAHSNSNQPKSTGTVDPDSLLGSMLKQDESIYVCPAGSDENSVSIQGLGKEDLGGIFSSDWQESVLSLSESSLFKQEPIISSGGDDSCEILSFMRSLGISPEDLKLLQQDEVFLRVDFDGCSNMADLTDGVLSYVQQSLRKKTDSIMSSDAQANLGKHVQTPPWHQQPYSCNSLILGSQEQQMSFIMEHPEPKIQHFTQIQTQLQNTGDIPKHQNNPQRHQHTMSHPYNGLGTSQYELSNVTVQKQQIQMVSQQLQTAHSKKQQPHCPYLPPPYQHVCNTLNDAQVCGNLTEVLTSNTQQVSPFFQPELQQPGCFYLETSPVELEHPYRNHLNNVSISCSQEHSSSYITSGDADEGEFTAHDLEELLNSLDAGGIERKGQPGHNGGAGIGPSLDQQAYIGQFQYGSHTNYAMENNTAHPAQLTNQHQNKSRPHPNLSLGGYL
ncbi:aryl hydrocarbon receptor-like isoform X1 [Myxocyprinus asiaticus]|uniref:aryl hydrocarbon receptor-like isoform X1 n=1 Tax=Myxocyprinus asiaticus TaxID=70543 RepID=UPI002221F0E6|nr:aryl hydrocarbon receptor-like isoform X1 [Myxocyprinus asiaticus]